MGLHCSRRQSVRPIAGGFVFHGPPHEGKPLAGDLKGYYSVRLSYKDRIVYSIRDDELVVVIVRTKTHF